MDINDILHMSPEQLTEFLSGLPQQEIEEMLKATELYRNDYENRFDVYQPTIIAKEYHQSTADFRCIYGSNRSSKSWSACVDTISVALGRPPKSCESWWRHLKRTPTSCRVIGVDYREGIDNILLPIFKMVIPPAELRERFSYDKESRIMYFKNGSMIDFMSYESEIQKFSGVAKDKIQMDEEPPLAIFDECKKRVLTTDGQIDVAMTAEKGITWTYDDLYLRSDKIYRTIPKEGADSGDNRYTRNRKLIVQDSKTNNGIHSFRVTMYDNQHITDSQIERAIRDFPDKKKRERAVLGEFVHNTGLIYSEFNSLIHILDSKSVALDPNFPRFVSVDPNTRLGWVGLQACIDDKGNIYLEKEMATSAQSADVYEGLDSLLKEPQLIAATNKMFKPWFVFKIIDPGANTQDPFNRQITIFQELNRPPHLYGFRKANKNKSLGIQRVREALYYNEDKGITPKLYVFDNCVNTIWEFNHYVWEDWHTRTGERKNPKDVPQDKNDHFMECLYRFFLEPSFRFRDHDSVLESMRNPVDAHAWTG